MPSSLADKYDVEATELKWQGLWREAEVEVAPDPVEEGHGTYCSSTAPFTSGQAHMGHVRSHSICDSFARFRRRQGDAVLYSFGFDAFGLPSEIGALDHGVTPDEWVARCAGQMREQFTRLGFSIDWSRSFLSSDPEMYRWSQWLFLQLLERDLVYEQEAQVEWCPSCRTVLANLQVEDGACWRCHGPVEFVNRNQWWLRRSAYNAESHFRLDELEDGWSNIALAAQRASLGIVEGIEFDAQALDGSSLTVFTTHSDATEEGEFVLISPNHPEVERWISSPEVEEALKQARRGGGKREERRDASLWAVASGGMVMAPGIPDPIPVLISPSVDARYGPTAVLGIPAQDSTDRALREFLPEQGLGMRVKAPKVDFRPATRYRAGDFTISRQRAWGAPIPLIRCGDCGTVPVPYEDLPVRLPENLAAEPGAGLDRFPDFLECSCPRCGKPAQREPDTLDCHIDAAWSYVPPAVPPQARAETMFEHPDVPYWLPMRQLFQGADNGQFSLNMRLGAKMLRDIGALDFLADGEPFAAALMHEMVQGKDGRKMSKHIENVVNPLDLIDEYGADAIRFAVLYAAAPSRPFSWNDLALKHCAFFLSGFWSYAQPRLEARQGLLEDAEIDTADKWRSRLVLWCDKGTERVTQHFERLEPHQATRNIMRFADRVKDFEKRVLKQRGELTDADEDALAIALLRVVALLAPIAPHMAEELWRRAGREGFVCQAPWPGAGGPAGERQPQPVQTGAPS